MRRGEGEVVNVKKNADSVHFQYFSIFFKNYFYGKLSI